jgi:hypothetical protein
VPRAAWDGDHPVLVGGERGGVRQLGGVEGNVDKAVQGSVGVGDIRGTRGRWRSTPEIKIKIFFGGFDRK